VRAQPTAHPASAGRQAAEEGGARGTGACLPSLLDYSLPAFLISFFTANALNAGFGLQKSGSAAAICGEGRLIFGLKA